MNYIPLQVPERILAIKNLIESFFPNEKIRLWGLFESSKDKSHLSSIYIFYVNERGPFILTNSPIEQMNYELSLTKKRIRDASARDHAWLKYAYDFTEEDFDYFNQPDEEFKSHTIFELKQICSHHGKRCPEGDGEPGDNSYRHEVIKTNKGWQTQKIENVDFIARHKRINRVKRRLKEWPACQYGGQLYVMWDLGDPRAYWGCSVCSKK